ncbi:pseudouridine synthase [Fervidibacillus halotolerans]|uniref:Pseudouridine synthase n=1 Tax=Fervidibacillus halotolerans TaxID=2980027 RepID=A0A9E8LYS8_9BACI|nr:pseudouridine synthase [Fervidibacillus halotolerans]WAA11765.1 rRNA pseudouridine synthase [Fervidibacillus halotolerans]
MRIDKLLSNCGFGSRKEVKSILKSGIVSVNGQIISDGKVHVDPTIDDIRVGSEKVEYKKFVYIMMNKPPGVISATEDDWERTVVDLLSFEYTKYNPFPVGRLDKNTVGLLLLTNDGQLAHRLLSPKKHVEKTYFAIIDGPVTEKDRIQFAKGVCLDDGYVTKPAKLTINKSELDRSEIELTITEGKFHQVKRMFEAVHKKVIFLKRLSMGSLYLDEDLPEGSYRELTAEEIQRLRSSVGLE